MLTKSRPGSRASEPVLCDGSTPLPPQRRGGVLLLGNFDGLHRGHRSLLSLGRQVAGPHRPLGVMSADPHPRMFFDPAAGPMRIHPGAAGPLVLGREGVDFLFAPRFDAAFAGQSPHDFAERLLRHCLGVSDVIAGADFRFGARRAGDVRLLGQLGMRLGFRVHVAPAVSHAGRRVSSSGIRAAIAAGEIGRARGDLGGGWITPVRAEGGTFHFRPDQLLPPPETYYAHALDARGAWIGGAPLVLGADRIARAALPPETVFFDWFQFPEL